MERVGAVRFQVFRDIKVEMPVPAHMDADEISVHINCRLMIHSFEVQ